VTPGNLVAGGGATGQSTLLTTIVSIDPIYCYMDADERSVLKYQRLAREQKRVNVREGTIPCWLGLSDEEGFPRQGVIDFVNNTLDPSTGTMRARAVFDNKNGSLTPGLFARVRLPGSGRYTAVLIPDSAVQTDQNQKFVFVVRDGKTATYQKVELGSLYEKMRVITNGLTENDLVVINGFARLRPGAAVAPKEVVTPAPQTTTGMGSPTTQSLPTTREVHDSPPATQPMSSTK
jgi:multidrug efflux system membrane fusion protein